MKTVKFTYDNILQFAKVKFHLWKTTVQHSEDEGKARKNAVSNIKNKRMQRKRHIS